MKNTIIAALLLASVASVSAHPHLVVNVTTNENQNLWTTKIEVTNGADILGYKSVTYPNHPIDQAIIDRTTSFLYNSFPILSKYIEIYEANPSQENHDIVEDFKRVLGFGLDKLLTAPSEPQA